MTRGTLWEGIGPERITALAQAWHDRATAGPGGWARVLARMSARKRAFMAAADDVGLPQDIRDELLAYWRWATVHVNAYPDSGRDVPDRDAVRDMVRHQVHVN